MKSLTLSLTILAITLSMASSQFSPEEDGSGPPPFGPPPILFHLLQRGCEDAEEYRLPILDRFLGDGYACVVKQIVTGVSSIINMLSDENGIEELMEMVMGMLEARELEKPDPKEMILNVIGHFCCDEYVVCKNKAETCINAIKPEEEIMLFQQMCLPAMRDAFLAQRNPIEARIRCVGELFFNVTLGEDFSDDMKANVLTYLNYMVGDSTVVNGAYIINAVKTGSCKPPELDDLKIGATLNFNTCLLSKCVESL